MRYSLIFLFHSFFIMQVASSQVVNPFDIPNRGIATDVAQFSARDTSLSTSLIGDSLTTLSPEIAASDSISIETTVSISNANSRENSNPFEVRSGKAISVDSNNEGTIERREVKRAPAIQIAKSATGINNMVVLLFTLFSLIVTVGGISLNRAKFINLLKATTNSNRLKVLFRDRLGVIDAQFIILYALFFMNVSFFIYIALKGGFIHVGKAPAWHLLFAAFVLIYLVRHLVLFLISFTFPIGAEVPMFNYSIATHNIVLSCLFIPFILGLVFAPDLIKSYMFYVPVGLAVLIYLVRQAKGLLSMVSARNVNVIYFFLYLCAVEVAPILVGWRIINPLG